MASQTKRSHFLNAFATNTLGLVDILTEDFPDHKDLIKLSLLLKIMEPEVMYQKFKVLLPYRGHAEEKDIEFINQLDTFFSNIAPIEL